MNLHFFKVFFSNAPFFEYIPILKVVFKIIFLISEKVKKLFKITRNGTIYDKTQVWECNRL